MDINSIFTAGGIGTGMSIVLFVLVRLNHKRCRSVCCNREMSVSVDVEDTTPKLSQPTVDERQERAENQSDASGIQTPRQEAFKDDIQRLPTSHSIKYNAAGSMRIGKELSSLHDAERGVCDSKGKECF